MIIFNKQYLRRTWYLFDVTPGEDNYSRLINGQNSQSVWLELKSADDFQDDNKANIFHSKLIVDVHAEFHNFIYTEAIDPDTVMMF